jgi:hypothetical protein
MAFRQIIHNLRPQATISSIAIMCAVVFCLSFLFCNKAQATSADEITLRYNSNDIHTAVEFDVSHFAYVSDNNCVGVFMPNGETRTVLHLGFDNIYNQVIKLSPRHYMTIILTMYVPDAVDVADLYTMPHAVNGVVLVDFQSYSGTLYSSYGYSRHYKLTYYNPLDYEVDAFLGNSGRPLIYVSAKPHNPQVWVEKQWGVNVCAQSLYTYKKLNTTQEQNDFYKNENNAQNNIKNQNKNGDNSNNPTRKTQTLMDYFKNGIGAIQKMKKTNCNLKLDMGVAKFGDVDLCRLSVPSYIKIISSILVFSVCVPASIAIVRRIVAVIKEMQR